MDAEARKHGLLILFHGWGEIIQTAGSTPVPGDRQGALTGRAWLGSSPAMSCTLMAMLRMEPWRELKFRLWG